MKIVGELKQNTPEWHQFRSEGIGASEANIIMGASKFKTPRELWFDKVYGQRKEEKEYNFITEKGHKLEAKARPLFEMEMDADFPVNNRHLGDGLLEWDVDSPAANQSHLIFSRDWPGGMHAHPTQIRGLSWTDYLTGAASHTYGRRFVVGRFDPPRVAASHKIDRVGFHNLSADPDTQAA